MKTHAVALAPCPNARRVKGRASATKPNAPRTMNVVARRNVRRVSAATPGRSLAAANRDADGSIAVASETVSSECGRIHTVYAVW